MNFYRPTNSTPDDRKLWGRQNSFFRNAPSELDRRADVELTAGRHGVAERLANRAAELRAEASR